ncbi:MAG: phosphate ABC transporter substrate-binding protein PstS, partial [Burkholderiaceae bacterium]
PAPVYTAWGDAYKKASGNTLNYQIIGSSGGIKQIKARAVDFGATDMPLGSAELRENGLVQFPAIVGGVVPVVNIDGILPGQIKLTGQLLGDIFLGKIKTWNAPEIGLINPGINLPAKQITVAFRGDGSGTTFLFSDYLSKSNPEFRQLVGYGASVKWPIGVAGKGNDGVAANVQRIDGAIGYVEYAYAKKNRMQYTQLKNRDGHFVLPGEESFRAAAAGADWAKAPDFSLVLTDQEGSTSWPITGASFILMHKGSDSSSAKEALRFFDWAYRNGGQIASDLDYVSLPQSVYKLVEISWTSKLRDRSGKKIW